MPSPTEVFVRKAVPIHGDRYDYSNANYVSSKEKVSIICPVHGAFLQSPHAHITQRSGCPSCAAEKRGRKYALTSEEFSTKAKVTHDGKYDYSKVDYRNTKSKVEIVCPEHGSFWQTACDHLAGRGCPTCARSFVGEKNRSTLAEFLTKSNAIHGDRYDYSNANYVDSVTKIQISCSIHGPFWQTPNAHLLGQGCPVCGGRVKLTTEQFVTNAEVVHGDTYDYSETDYVTAKDPVKIICRIHGEFWQTPNNHTQGQGCPTCSASKGELVISKVLRGKDIKYVQEYSLPETSDRYRYDFYLPELGLLIEYHGVQHYKPIEFFGGEDQLRATQLRDKIKRSVAKALGYQYLEIGYKEFLTFSEEEFETRLMDLLNKFKARFMAKKAIFRRPKVS